MKKLTHVITLAILGATLSVRVAVAQPLIIVDEFGNGTINGNPLPSSIAVDPFSGIATLAYTLPFNSNPGDVVLFEPGPGPQQISDVLRFDGGNTLFFFSERESSDIPPFDPADVNQFPPPVAGLPTIFLQELGPEGNNGAIYTPNGGDPGYVNGIVGLRYHFISDVPEPSAGVLAGAGLLILSGSNWTRKLRRRA